MRAIRVGDIYINIDNIVCWLPCDEGIRVYLSSGQYFIVTTTAEEFAAVILPQNSVPPPSEN